MTTTIAASEVPYSLLNAQGCATILDPVAIKKSSAAKMRLADKTGNVALRKEAAAEQSFADRLGGRTALLSDELKKQIQEQKEATASSPLEGSPETEESNEKRNRRKKDKQPEDTEQQTDEQDAPRQRQPLQPTSQPFQPSMQRGIPMIKSASHSSVISALSSTNAASVAVPPEAIILKLDAASKQSIADKTGNLILKRTAALEQSLADKMAFVSAPGITTTALRSGRKGFVLDANFQAQTTQSPPQASVELTSKSQPSSPVTQRKAKQQQKPFQPFQKKERSYFNNTNNGTTVAAPSRADMVNDWRTPRQTSPTPMLQPRTTSPRPSKDGAVVEHTVKRHFDTSMIKQHIADAPVVNSLAPAPASM